MGDMQGAGCVLIQDCDENTHRGFEVELFTNPPGAQNNKDDYPIRSVLSSFYWGEGTVQGVPDGQSDCKLHKILRHMPRYAVCEGARPYFEGLRQRCRQVHPCSSGQCHHQCYATVDGARGTSSEQHG